jgi:hypothetical protein
MKINVAPDRSKYYYAQTNNEIDPYNSCQVTSMVALLDISKYGLDPILRIAGYKQPEDKLRYFIETDPAIQAFYKKNFNTLIPAPEWSGVMVYAVNKLYDKKPVYYDDFLDLDDIKEDLSNGLPLYTSMKYMNNKNAAGRLSPILGHIVCIVGIENDDSIIINDPYKNCLTGEKDGFNNIYTVEQFNAHNKGYAVRLRKA